MPDSEKNTPTPKATGTSPKAPFIGISRHRIGIDGEGVTTLAAFHGCPLDCRYCLNASCKGPTQELPHYTPEELYNMLMIDNLYFIATGGGVCFGGGEPLLRVEYIKLFRELCGKDWKITIESSLNVPAHNVEEIAAIADYYIIDIKDCNDEIYFAYTGRHNSRVMKNLQYLVEHVGPDRITARLPLIPDYNTPEDVERSAALLKEMGIQNLDRFTYKCEI